MLMNGESWIEPAARNSAIRMQKTKFAGAIIVNESSQFELVLDRDGPRYVGHPTRELDAAWDKLVGTLLPPFPSFRFPAFNYLPSIARQHTLKSSQTHTFPNRELRGAHQIRGGAPRRRTRLGRRRRVLCRHARAAQPALRELPPQGGLREVVPDDPAREQVERAYVLATRR